LIKTKLKSLGSRGDDLAKVDIPPG